MLEDNNQQILLQKFEIRSLKDQIIRLLEERGDEASNNGEIAKDPHQNASSMRIGSKLTKEKESFLPRVDSKQKF